MQKMLRHKNLMYYDAHQVNLASIKFVVPLSPLVAGNLLLVARQ